MGIRLDKPWLNLGDEAVHALPGQLGVYQLGDDDGTVRYIGYAGGRDPFGLRSALAAHVGSGPTRFRYEVNQAYLTRWQELLMIHRADHGDLPPDNDKSVRLGRLRPA